MSSKKAAYHSFPDQLVNKLVRGIRSLFLFELEVDPCIQYRPLTLRGAGRESRWSDRSE